MEKKNNGHYNNYNYRDSWERGGEFVIRGKGINIFRDILLGLYNPGIYHDPMPYANIPRMDREKFYKDTFEFSDETKKYALSRMGRCKNILRKPMVPVEKENEKKIDVTLKDLNLIK